MLSRRNLIFRCTIAGLLLYIFTHIASRNGASEFISELQQSGRSLAALESQDSSAVSTNNANTLVREQNTNGNKNNDITKKINVDTPTSQLSAKTFYVGNEPLVIYDRVKDSNNAEKTDADISKVNLASPSEGEADAAKTAADSTNTGNGNGNGEETESVIMSLVKKPDTEPAVENDNNNPLSTELNSNSANIVDIIDERERELAPAQSSLMPATTTQRPHDFSERLLNVLKCHDRPMSARTQQRGDYWVLYNYVRAEHRHRCHESVTYTTHADYTFMDNLVPLVERWNGPISVAMHAPGTDFAATLATIGHLRDCTSPLVREYVTFHIFFSTKHVPKQVPRHDRVLLEPFNCSVTPPYLNFSTSQMYKTVKKLLYPVNVGRNVARESAQTHFVFASDIELYPSPNLIPQFLEMIAENKGPLLRKNPKVFVLSIFEVAANYQIPDNKTRLKEMLANGTAIPFHKKVCNFCHNVPKSKEWQAANETKGLHIFHIGKRTGMFVHWEPIFIGTHADPLYDERLSWEGKSDKMTQGYALCVLDYDFQILDNAFLCHKPGIKTYKKDPKRAILAGRTNQLIKKIIFPELKILYGIRKGCAV